jgi:predicted NUDIX family phosphoesterase
MDETNQKVVSLVEEYLTYQQQYNSSLDKLGAISEEAAEAGEVKTGLYYEISSKQNSIEELRAESDRLISKKGELNQLFYSTFSRFI